MTEVDIYLESVLARYTPQADGTRVQALSASSASLSALITRWAGPHLQQIKLSGSNAKGTAIRGSSDLDLLISIAPSDNLTLSAIYYSLDKMLKENGYTPRQQSVSLRVLHGSIEVDLVPAKQSAGALLTTDHWLYKRKSNSHQKTNVDTHVRHVKQSGRVQDIRLLKVWRQLHGLEFPSFYLELSVIRALQSVGLLSVRSNNFRTVLQYLERDFETASIIDPANSNNIVSDDLSVAEKRAIANAASMSLRKNWNEVLW